ncbi:MAG: ATP synthase F0 subunit B [Deltaproteobacteria bacterium]|nr:ATP synthase F0 subunit B [Deltaproteobacteria bacterium]
MIDLDYTVFLQAFIFLSLFLILRKLLFEPYLALFEERERLVAGMKDEAAALDKDFRDKAAVFDGHVREATAKAAAIMEKLKAEGQAAQRDILGRARRDAAARVEEAVKGLKAETESVRKDIERDIGTIALQITEKVLGRKIG